MRRKSKDWAVAARTDRHDMEIASQGFGVELWEHVGNVITAMRRIAQELDLVGSIQPQT